MNKAIVFIKLIENFFIFVIFIMWAFVNHIKEVETL